MPEGGRPMEPKSQIVRWKGRLYQTPLEAEEAATPLQGSALGFAVNGKWQVRPCPALCSVFSWSCSVNGTWQVHPFLVP